jgi:hypothetical protein
LSMMFSRRATPSRLTMGAIAPMRAAGITPPVAGCR